MSDSKHQIVTTAPDGPIQQRMAPAFEMGLRALGANADPAAIRELLALQREWEAGEAKKSFQHAMVALKRDLPTVLDRDKLVEFPSKSGSVSYRHTTLAAAMDAVSAPLTTHGFSVSWKPGKDDKGNVQVTCGLSHADGHTETCTLSAPVDTSGSKSPAQGTMSTITLLQRYTLLSLLGIATRDHVEPAGDPADSIDVNRNMKAAAWLKKHGRTPAEAEQYLEKKVQQWNGADLEELREWATRKDDDNEG